MTRVNIAFDKEYVKVTVKGHAGFGIKNNLPEGHDIVCSAISILSQTLIQRLLTMAEENKVLLNLNRYEPGDINIHAVVKKSHMDEVKSTLETISTGYRMIETEYPDYVKVGVLDSEKRM
ncbi:ribosomal-processing cysteine protease Prp [Enterocloster citroniae]|uniref:ribosomal-processing cysteine protease Prp n=1 Tax=Enterocloster citroniae TaxID=358743 RepID=UPI001D0856F1|nr:ribosomal-processing cysteine protease Prp [Enterocloster citroniae]